MALRAGANEANYQPFIIGERAAGMGGAACAIAESVDACYYNPAGLTRLQRDSLSLSASLYGFQKYEADNGLYPQEDLRTDSFAAIPSTMGAAYRLSTNVAAAFAVFIPYKGTFSDVVRFQNTQHYYKSALDDQTLWIGPSIGYQVCPELALGASVFGVFRSFSYLNSLFWEAEKLSYSYDIKSQNLGALAAVGAQYRPDDRWNFGLQLQSPSANLWGDGTFQADKLSDQGKGTSTAYYADHLGTCNQIPLKLTGGVAWEKPRAYALGVDLSYHLATSYHPLDDFPAEQGQVDVTVQRRDVVDVNLGAEYYLRQRYPIRGGFFTSFSAAPDLKVSDREEYSLAQIDLYGLTCSVGSERKNINVNVGLNYIFGSGEAYGWDITSGQLKPTIVDATESYAYFFFNTSYMF